MAIEKILVANRGEIARRIFRTCREMGINSVAVYSDADATEPHVREADEAVHLPGNTARETYLATDGVLAAARMTGADAVHPGYGFLSENASFAESVIEAGMTWIGPPPRAIERMGSKVAARRLMESSGVPVVPGFDLTGLSTAGSAATSLGFPVLVKASAGGGGIGMRIVYRADDLGEAIASAGREAKSAFGDDTVFLEKYLEAPRHIEIQILADDHGNTVSLFERECSIQRRHQKIIEESPSPGIDDEVRSAMSETAVSVARAVDYRGAGTVEFLFQDAAFYFLEMNTRLQVEHPVTEMVTGLDLVRLQIEIAGGGRLPEVALHPRMEGHAIEARLYAEDPANDFLPATGPVHRFDFEERPGLRVDSGVADGSTVTIHYDPMLAKIVFHGPTREEAAENLAISLRQARIHGPVTNRALLVHILENEDFLAGRTDTHLLERNGVTELSRPLLGMEQERFAAIAAALADQAERRRSATNLRTIPSGWRNSAAMPQMATYTGAHGDHEVRYRITGAKAIVDGVGVLDLIEVDPDGAHFMTGDTDHIFAVARHGERRFVDSAEGPAYFRLQSRFPDARAQMGVGSLHAPMPGRVLRVGVRKGDVVKKGQVLLVLEAMKMEHSLRAPHAGPVTEVRCREGDQIEAGAVLIVIAEPG